MKREVVPTSPQYNGDDKKKTRSAREKYKIGISELLIILLISFVGGLCGGLIIDNIIKDPMVRNGLVKEIIYTEKQTKTDSEVKTEEALEKIKPSVVSFYAKKKNDNYTPTQALGSGVVITSDGWIITPTKVMADELIDYVVITSDNQIYNIDTIVKDDYSGTVFVKIKSENLTAAQFVNEDNLSVGDIFLASYNALYSGQRVEQTVLENLAFNDEVLLSTEINPFDYLVTDTLRSEYLGSPLLNEQGEVVGLNLLDNRVLPHRYYINIMTQVISKQEINRTKFALEYIDISRGLGYENYEKGAVIKTIISQNTDLKVNDIILKVDDVEIDKFHNLSHILENYSSGDLAKFSLIRQGNEIEVEVQL